MEKLATPPTHTAPQGVRPLTDDEQALLVHISRWGSAGYPVRKLGSGWTWGPWRSIQGSPLVYRTRREAVASFEAYHGVLIARKAGRE